MLMTHFILLLGGMYVFSSKQKHLLLTLLSLEFMVLAIFMAIFIMLSSFHLVFSLLYLVFAACEGALELSILISMSRAYSGHYFSVFNFG